MHKERAPAGQEPNTLENRSCNSNGMWKHLSVAQPLSQVSYIPFTIAQR